jgi:hypothetical protein
MIVYQLQMTITSKERTQGNLRILEGQMEELTVKTQNEEIGKLVAPGDWI